MLILCSVASLPEPLVTAIGPMPQIRAPRAEVDQSNCRAHFRDSRLPALNLLFVKKIRGLKARRRYSRSWPESVRALDIHALTSQGTVSKHSRRAHEALARRATTTLGGFESVKSAQLSTKGHSWPFRAERAAS